MSYTVDWSVYNKAVRLHAATETAKVYGFPKEPPSVPTTVRHLSPGSLDPKALKDHLAHAHAPYTERGRNRCRHVRKLKADGRGGTGDFG